MVMVYEERVFCFARHSTKELRMVSVPQDNYLCFKIGFGVVLMTFSIRRSGNLLLLSL